MSSPQLHPAAFHSGGGDNASPNHKTCSAYERTGFGMNLPKEVVDQWASIGLNIRHFQVAFESVENAPQSISECVDVVLLSPRLWLKRRYIRYATGIVNQIPHDKF